MDQTKIVARRQHNITNKINCPFIVSYACPCAFIVNCIPEELAEFEMMNNVDKKIELVTMIVNR